MAHTITQETFDDAVKENMSEFGMTQEEAVEDTVKQFEAQGVDLSNIIKGLMVSAPSDTTAIEKTLVDLGKLVKSKPLSSDTEIIDNLALFKIECDKGIAYKVYAGNRGAYNLFMDLLEKYDDRKDVVKQSLKTLTSLMTKQPDLLDKAGIRKMISILKTEKDIEILQLTLQWIKECCTMHEVNRQNIFDANILENLKALLPKADEETLRDILGVLRSLVLDDDVRVEFGRAHEHARVIASDLLSPITEYLTHYKANEALINDLMLTMSALLVRSEFCQKVNDANGLSMIKDAMVTFYDKERIIKQCFKLLKVLAGNDKVKVDIIQKDFAPVITSCLNRHKTSTPTCSAGLGTVAALTLRSAENSKALYEAGIAEVIVECMKNHPNDLNLQKSGSWAIRNMVSRSRYQNQAFLDLGIEEILKKDLKQFKAIEYDVKSALRDLGCKVEFKEEWTGKGGLLNTQTKPSKV